MDCWYEYSSRSPSASAYSRPPGSTGRTATGVAKAPPVSTTIARPRAAALTRLWLPDALRLVEVDRARMEVDRRALRRRVELEVLRLRVDEHKVGLVVEHRGEDRLHERGIEGRGHHEQVRDAGGDDVRVVALVRSLRDLRGEVEVAVLRVHLRDGVGLVDELDRRRVRDIGDGAGGQAAVEEERVDLSVAQRVGRVLGVQALRLDVGRRVEAIRLEDPDALGLGPGARGTDRDALALQVGDRVDAAARLGDDVHVVRVHDRDRLRVDLRLRRGEPVLPVDRVVRRVGEGEREVGLAVADELHVVDGGRRGLRARGDLHL